MIDSMTEERLAAAVRERLSPKRWLHTQGVVKAACALAARYGANADKSRIAALLHDVTKGEDRQGQLELCRRFGIALSEQDKASPPVLHAITGAAYAGQVLGVDDREILDAIRYHTTGRAGMSVQEKVIYLADCIEENRTYDGVEDIRNAALNGLDAAMIAALSGTIREITARRVPLHIDTVECYNSLLITQNRKDDEIG